MKVDEIIIEGNRTIREAIKMLNEKSMQILLVADEKKRLIGTITDGDIRRAILKGISLNKPVELIMSKNPKYVFEDTPRDFVTEMFRKYGIKRIPIVDKSLRIIDILLIENFMEKYIKQKPNYVVIMAGGKGSRLDPFTKILPKPLIPIGDKTMLEIIMEKFALQGFNRFVLTLNYKKEIIKLYLQDNNFPYEINWIEEDKPLGTVGSLKLILEKFSLNDNPLIVTNCDVLINVDFEEVLKFHHDHNAMITIIGYLESMKIPYGVIKMKEEIFLEMQEKPEIDIIINTGVYVMKPSIKRFIKDNEKLDVPELLKRVKNENEKIVVYPYHGDFFDIGQWELYRKSVKKLLNTY